MENRFPYSNTRMPLDIVRSENSPASEDDEKIYVVMGDDAKDTESTLLWAIRNSGGRKLCILHVHDQPQTIPIFGIYHHISTLPDYKVKAYQETEKQVIISAMEDCIRFCQKLGVEAERLFAERESVEKGMLELVYQYKIKYLVIGAAGNTNHGRNMIEPVSEMATYVQLNAPVSCNIWFIYKGQLVYARDSCLQSNQHAAKERLVALQQPSSSNASSSSRTNDRDYNHQMYSTSNAQVEESRDVNNCGPLTRALVESGKCKQQTCADTAWCLSFQLEAISRLNESESLYLGELRRRKEKEEELDMLNGLLRKMAEDLQLAENKSAVYEQKIRDLEKGGMFNSGDVHKGNRGKFIDPYAESSSSRKEIQHYLHELSFNEIIKATCDLDPLLLIREVGYDSVYRGKLSETDVAIKILQPDEMQFQKEVEVLSKFRHPNMITLMGVCSEASALAYEYLPNGSLEDRLDRKDNTPSLPWQTRISIATELCSTLIFFHSREPHRLVHAALKPSCIYLDSNFSCKIGDYRSSFMVPVNGNSVRDNSLAVNSVYMDPEFVATREVSPDMDVYAYGIILLKLLTARTALRLVDRVKSALTNHELEQILDTSAGEWPVWQAKQLAHLGLSCCEHSSDLKLDVWPVLEQMRRMNNESAEASNSSQPDDDEPPFYFICPILQEPMKDPHVAADGFTYEADALREWLNSGHDTSPMTNMRLPHLNLVPNLALRSAIKEWQDQQREN